MRQTLFVGVDNSQKNQNIDKKKFNDWYSRYYAEKNHQKYGFFGQPNEFVQSMFDLFDVNKDGNMSFEEQEF